MYLCVSIKVKLKGWNLTDERVIVIISMMVILYASDIEGCDRRRSGLSSAPLDVEYDHNGTER